jgi:phenylacetate-CoA ligase
MTEIWPLGAAHCPDGHLHFEPAQGLIEVVDPETGAPTGPGQIGTIEATPFAPYRQTTLLLRYDTEDLVRRLAEPASCRLAHLPATGPLLGKRRLAVRHDHGWTTPRDVIEALEATEAVPLPARLGFWGVPGGVAVEVVARSDTFETRRAIERQLEAHGVPVRELRLVQHRAALSQPFPWRCDLRKATFAPPIAGRGATGPHDEPSRLRGAASPAGLTLPLPGSMPWS